MSESKSIFKKGRFSSFWYVLKSRKKTPFKIDFDSLIYLVLATKNKNLFIFGFFLGYFIRGIPVVLEIFADNVVPYGATNYFFTVRKMLK